MQLGLILKVKNKILNLNILKHVLINQPKEQQPIEEKETENFNDLKLFIFFFYFRISIYMCFNLVIFFIMQFYFYFYNISYLRDDIFSLNKLLFALNKYYSQQNKVLQSYSSKRKVSVILRKFFRKFKIKELIDYKATNPNVGTIFTK